MNIRKSLKGLLNYINLNTFLYLFFICIGLFNLYYLTNIYPRRGENLSFDYMGIIVGILSLLVGFLVAWQIYKTIEVDKKIEAINNSSKDAIAEDMFYKWYSRLLEDCHIGLILVATQACISSLNMNFTEDKAKLFYEAFKLHDTAYYGMGKEYVDKVRAELDKLKFKSKAIDKCYEYLDEIIKKNKYEAIS